MHALLGVVEVVGRRSGGVVMVGLQESGARGVVVFKGQPLGSSRPDEKLVGRRGDGGT